MNGVNNLKHKADLGEWRGHDVKLDVEKGTFGSDSAGLSGCKTVAEVKRLIDAQEKRRYKPVKAILISNYGRTLSESVTITGPAKKSSVFGGEVKDAHYWVKVGTGARNKLRGSDLALDVPGVREQLAEVKRLRDAIAEIQTKANEVLRAIPRLDALEMEELEPGDD